MITNTIIKLRSELVNTFNLVFEAFNNTNEQMQYKPADGGWTIAEILEHIVLTNHYLLLLIRKGTKRALDKARTVDPTCLLKNYELDWEGLQAIGEHRSFTWERPEHMEPFGQTPLPLIKHKLHDQLIESLNYLNELKNGEGVLHVTMMSVNGLGKIDVYHYIYFLAQHAKRHLTQIEGIKSEAQLSNVLEEEQFAVA